MSHGVTFTIGEQNLHDEFGRATPFADVLFFCEAIAPTVRERVRLWRQERRRAVVCREQRDLVLVLPWPEFKVTGKQYFRAHRGIAKVTPHRGVFVVKVLHRPTGRRIAFVLEHRINSWWKNERGEELLRSTLWHRHADLTLRVIDGLKHENYTVFAAGDLNCPPNVKGYSGHLTEVSSSLDRIACSRDAQLTDFQRLSREGSDHHRIKATAHL